MNKATKKQKKMSASNIYHFRILGNFSHYILDELVINYK